jgi:predicted acyltransferase
MRVDLPQNTEEVTMQANDGINVCEKKKEGRLVSLDALRGFDMLFIMGGEALVYAVAAVFGCTELPAKFGHVPWHGLQFMDIIFPLFLFMAGVSFPFSCAKSRAQGLSDGRIALRALKRGVILVLLGLVCSRVLNFDFEHLRVWSVLGRIGTAWMLAAWIYLIFGVKTRLCIAAGILAVVTVGTIFITAPGAAVPVDPFSQEGNFGCWLDRTVTGGHTYRPLYDPEGFSGFLPSIVTAMLGMFAGGIIRRGGLAATGRKALELLAAGVFCLVAGLALSQDFPINKSLWSPSFVLVVGGISFALFSLFYWIIDVRGWRKWTTFFTVIGMNSITIYMAQRIIGFRDIAGFFFNGVASLFPEVWGVVVLKIGYIAVCWLFLYFLHRQRIYLKV